MKKILSNWIMELMDQNPLSQVYIMIARDGVVEFLGGGCMLNYVTIDFANMEANPQQILALLDINNSSKWEPKGEFSLQNCIDVGRVVLAGSSSKASKEMILVASTIFSTDPGDVFESIKAVIYNSNQRQS